MKVALYLRVSTGEQTIEPQRLELREYCQRRGWSDVVEYSDQISGSKFTRDGLEALMSDVRKGRVKAVVCVKLDRIGRSLAHLAQIFAELETNRCAFICTSQGIDTTDGNPAGRLQMHILSAVADFELSLIRERSAAGVRAARAAGKLIGRPQERLGERESAALLAFVEKQPGCAKNLRELAPLLGCSVSKAGYLVRRFQPEPHPCVYGESKRDSHEWYIRNGSSYCRHCGATMDEAGVIQPAKQSTPHA